MNQVHRAVFEKNGQLEALMRKYEELFKLGMSGVEDKVDSLPIPSSAKPDLYHFQLSNVLGRNLDRLGIAAARLQRWALHVGRCY